MSETQEREIELVAGTIGGITQKKADTWTIQVMAEGSKYARNLWTKDKDLVDSLSTKIGQSGAFVGGLGAPYTVDGKEVRSWWIQGEADGTENVPERVVTPSAAQQVPDRILGADLNRPAAKSSGEMSKEEWARKDSAIHKMACIKTAAAALTHTVPSDPSTEQLDRFYKDVMHLANGWHRSVLMERDDPTGDSTPF